jgi:hypothetical protein
MTKDWPVKGRAILPAAAFQAASSAVAGLGAPAKSRLRPRLAAPQFLPAALGFILRPPLRLYFPFRYAMSAAGSSLMMASTLAAISASHTAGVFAVHGTTWTPAACAAATFSGVTR